MEDFYYYEAKNLPWFLCMFNEENRQSAEMKLLTGDFLVAMHTTKRFREPFGVIL